MAVSIEKRLDKIESSIDRMSLAMVKGFEGARLDRQAIREEIKNSIDIYARAVDAYAKQAETYMQEMLALGAKVDRLEAQIQQIAKHLDLKLVN